MQKIWTSPSDTISISLMSSTKIVTAARDAVSMYLITPSKKYIDEYDITMTHTKKLGGILRLRIANKNILITTEEGLFVFDDALELTHKIISDDIHDGLFHKGELHYVLSDGIVSVIAGFTEFDSRLLRHENQIISYRDSIMTTRLQYDHLTSAGNDVMFASDLKKVYYGVDFTDMREFKLAHGMNGATDIRVTADAGTVVAGTVAKGRVAIYRRDGLAFKTAMRYFMGTVYDTFPCEDACTSVVTVSSDLVLLARVSGVYIIIPH